MPNLNYNRGVYFERKVMAKMRNKNYLVFRTAGSRSPIDLIVFTGGEIMLIQCKSDGKLRPVERLQLIDIAQGQRVSVYLAVPVEPRGTIEFRNLEEGGKTWFRL